MTDNEMDRLRGESAKPRELADEDPLTGLLSRRAVAAKANEALTRQRKGVMVLLNVNSFKTVNEQHGHLQGDKMLKAVATAFGDMFWSRDIVGRIDGDEFVAFISTNATAQLISDKTEQLRQRLEAISGQYGLAGSLTFSLGAAFWQEGDDFNTMQQRAKKNLVKDRAGAKNAGRGRPKGDKAGTDRKSIHVDMALIRQDLREQGEISGAYCQDYNTFKQIYRFVERGLKRSEQSAYVILLTLTDDKGNFVPLVERADHMARLHTIIQRSLRSGDVFSQYSSGQFILMVLDAAHDNACMIGERIKLAFDQALPDRDDLNLQFDVYPMEPVE